MSPEGKILEALESAPYLVNDNGIWVPREDVEHEEDFALNREHYSQLSDGHKIGLSKDGLHVYESQIIVSDPDELTELLKGVYSLQGVDPVSNFSAIKDTVEHEMDHLNYAVEVMGGEDWELGMAFFRFPEQYLRKSDVGGRKIFYYIPFALGSMAGPKAGIAAVYANPLEPSDDDLRVCAEYGYPSLEALGDAIEALGLPMPRSVPRPAVHLDLDEIPLERGVVLINVPPEAQTTTVEGSLGQIVTALGSLAGKSIRDTALGLEDRIAALEQLLHPPDPRLDETQLEQLRVAHEKLCAAIEVLSGGVNDVRGNIITYLSDIVGDV